MENGMGAVGYIYIDPTPGQEVPVEVQRQQITEYASAQSIRLDRFVVEENSSLKRPFRERRMGKKLLAELGVHDSIIAGRAEWVLGSVKEALWLVKALNAQAISLYCIDLDENISLPRPRKLVVSEGGAMLVRKILEALSLCDSSKHGEAIRAAKKKMKSQGKYLGGPVPFGSRVEDGYLVSDPAQQRILEDIRQMRRDRWSYRDISIKLRKEYSVKLSHEGIRRVLLNSEE